MPIDKKPQERLLELNNLFNTRKGNNSVVPVSEILERLGISLRTFREDAKKLIDKGAPLVFDHKLKGWKYKHPFDFSDPIPLSADDLTLLRVAVETLSMVNHLDDFHRLPAVLDKIRNAVEKWLVEDAPGKAIYFDPLPHYEGSAHLSFFLKAIDHEHRVQFQYKAFHATEPKTIVFDPYFLRHYDRRWYVGGFSHDPAEGFIRTFPLERIVGEPEQKGYFHDKPKDYSPDVYWGQIYGITIPPDGTVEEVRLAFTPVLGRYFLTTPFFEPFDLLEDTADGITIRMNLIPNIDLVRKLGSYGMDVKVLKPERLAEQIKLFHEKALEQYF